ncbi:hypothetical protein AVEN_247630-1 [Araneus ventricosus]|uniref:RNase H type-1 domain-containing protein n=1 Tax=Araneus ventricosus TaxID=182803 RepID=A0A4Y2DV11_ARAVE|nr:hypothetical protein AVEN_247630-1 [Araneus ventricosus]
MRVDDVSAPCTTLHAVILSVTAPVQLRSGAVWVHPASFSSGDVLQSFHFFPGDQVVCSGLNLGALRAELIALQEAVKYAQNHQNKVKIWSDSQSSLKALLNEKSNSAKARYIHDSLYIRLGWIRAHVGHMGKEKDDELAKEAIMSTEAAVLTVPLYRSSAK